VSPRSPSSAPATPTGRVDGWPPRWLTKVPAADVRRGDGELYCDFAEAVCRVTKDSFAAQAGALIRMRPWERRMFGHLLARRPSGRFRHRQALVGMARKNAKSTKGSELALGGLVLGPAGGEVYSAAGDREQARIVFGTARRMVELDPELSEVLKLYRDVIEYPETGSVYRCLSAEAYTKEGLNPSLVVFDEVHVQPNRELWDVLALASGARVDPLMVGITTAGVKTDSSGRDSLCYQLYQHGRRIVTGEIEDPSFFFAWWEPRNVAANHRDPKVWREANPGFGDFIDPEDFATSVVRTPENEFRTKRLNQWVATSHAWLPAGAWGRCEDRARVIEAGSRVVLSFDGSFNNDCTALSVVTVEEHPHIDVAALWERPDDAGDEWQVPVLDVEAAIREACRRWQVVEIVCDPFRWARTYQVLEGEGLPIVEYPQTPARMTPATDRFFKAVVNRQATQSGDKRMARHLDNCVLRTDSRGSRLAKESKASRRRIDLAVTAVMGLDRAAWHATHRPAAAPAAAPSQPAGSDREVWRPSGRLNI
jgi:phage terminase large subunit-like protein